jgi:hypothetical protein
MVDKEPNDTDRPNIFDQLAAIEGSISVFDKTWPPAMTFPVPPPPSPSPPVVYVPRSAVARLVEDALILLRSQSTDENGYVAYLPFDVNQSFDERALIFLQSLVSVNVKLKLK